MTIRLRQALLATSLLCALTAPVAAHEYEHGDLVIGHPWARATAAAAPVAGGYMTITNTGATIERLIGGEAPFAGHVEIHEMALDDGVMRMRELADGLEIAPGDTVALEPGGYHVMFMQLQEPLVEGEMRSATLVFENAGTLQVEFAVHGLGATEPGAHDHAH